MSFFSKPCRSSLPIPETSRFRRDRVRRSVFTKSAAFLFSAFFALLLTAPPARPWGAFRGVAGIKITDTHQQIMLAAYNLLMSDPRFLGLSGLPIAGGRSARFENIVAYEGVDANLNTLAPYGPGPDAEGLTLYSCHWFNPATGRGNAPQSAADWFQRFEQSISGIGGTDEDAFKGLAWSAHFLADMFVPYHLNGMPADEALARMNARNFIIGPNEAGPSYFIDPAPAAPSTATPLPYERQARETLSGWWRDGWGVESNFRETYAIFAANFNKVAAAREPVNHLDWFDPWYWNGTSPQAANPLPPANIDPQTDPARAIFSSHASYEAIAHGRFVEQGGYQPPFGQGPPYDPLWKNAPPDYQFSGNAWQAQAWQVQDFAAKAAARTLQNAELCWRQPEFSIRAAVAGVYTLWRAAYSALQPVIQAGRDPTRPNAGLVIQVIVQNHAYEPCHDVRLRMRLQKGANAVLQENQALTAPVTRDGGGQMSWFERVNPNEEWTIVVEAVGIYDHTPDLQYAMSYGLYRPDPSQTPLWPEEQQARPIEEAETTDFVGHWNLSDPMRSFDEYHGTMDLFADGGLKIYERVKGQDLNDTGTWKFDRAAMTFSFGIPNGGHFSGTVRGNTRDFTIDGTWNNGTRGQTRFRR